MYNVETYQKTNKLQTRDSICCLEEHGHKIRWRHYDRIIDIGCGDGGVTTQVVKRFARKDFKKLIGCDVNEEMVRFASERHTDERTSFVLCDIEGQLPDQLRGEFDHAFSFYALHWIRDQEGAFTNIYNLLADGGDCLLAFLGYNPIYSVYRTLAKQREWRSWLGDVDRFVSPYHDSQEPEKEVKRLLDKIGFNNVEVTCQPNEFVYESIEMMKNVVRGICPFKLPPDVLEQFLEDYVGVVRDMQLIDKANNNLGDGSIRFSYNLITVYATK